MTKEDKQLLLKDICARLPYGVKIKVTATLENLHPGDEVKLLGCNPISEYPMFNTYRGSLLCGEFKPYLRPMSSMTDEEEFKLNSKQLFQPAVDKDDEGWYDNSEITSYMDFLNSHHFDYRGLIEKGLALEAPVDMYKTE